MTTAHPADSGAAVDINPASAIYANARYQPDSVAIRYPGGDLTYAQLNDRAARLAAVLTERGVAGGDRMAYLGLNSPAFLVTMFAAFRLGAIFVPVNFRLAGPELQAVLQGSGATAIVCEDGHRDTLDAMRDQTELKHFLLIDDDPEIPATPEPVKEWQPWGLCSRRRNHPPCWRDAEASARWWAELLELTEIDRVGGDGRRAILLLHPPSRTVIEFQQHDGNQGETFDPRRTGFDHMGFKVDTRADLDMWLARFEQLDVTHSPIAEAEYGAVLPFKDPDGIQFEMFFKADHP